MTDSKAFSFTVDDSVRADLFLSRKTGQSREFVQEQIKAERVLRNGAILTKAAQKVVPGDVLTGHFEERPASNLTPVEFPLEVLHEDADLIVINKPQDMVVHPAVGYTGPTLVHYLLHYLKHDSRFPELSDTRPGIVHRLDRGTSGVILIAKNRPALESLSAQFKDRQVKKQYEALVWGKMKEKGMFQSEIGRDTKDRKKMSSKTNKGREAVTEYQLGRAYAHFSHVALFPLTGRTHQLRVHLSEAGFPIVGDPLYSKRAAGRKRAHLPEAIRGAVEALKHPFLHARRLDFTHPVTKKLIRCEASRPKEFDAFLENLKKLES